MAFYFSFILPVFKTIVFSPGPVDIHFFHRTLKEDRGRDGEKSPRLIFPPSAPDQPPEIDARRQTECPEKTALPGFSTKPTALMMDEELIN
jgi:hypothetical protein